MAMPQVEQTLARLSVSRHGIVPKGPGIALQVAAYYLREGYTAVGQAGAEGAR